jgi:hypothetical protein
MPTMVRDRTLRRPLACLAVLGLLGLAVLPAEHIHAVQTDSGHRSDVVHRHVGAHHHTAPTDHTVDQDHHDEALWLDSSFVAPPSGSPVHPPLLYEDLWIAEALPILRRTLSTPPIAGHDPPWTRSLALRGPPSPVV